MNRWKFFCIILLLACIALACFWGAASWRLAQSDALVNEYVKIKLRDQGYQEGEYEKPEIKDAPQGSKPLLHVSGKVHYAPIPAAVAVEIPVLPSEAAPVAGSYFPRGNPCDLNELDVTIGCSVDTMQEPGRPFARLLASGEIKGWDQVRILPEQPSGEIHLQVAPSMKPKAWGLDFLAGAAIGSRNGIEVGFSGTGKSRLGWYSLLEYQYATGGAAYDAYRETTYSTGDSATFRLHAGIKLRLR